MKLLFLINTYRRNKQLHKLLQNINEYCSQFTIEIVIVEDNSSEDYSACHTFLANEFAGEYTWYKLDNHCGKKNYWQLTRQAYQLIKGKQYKYLFHLPDDVLLTPDFVNTSIAIFEEIIDKKKGCLNLLKDYSRKTTGWTSTKEEIVKFANTTVLKTGWVDMCYMASPKFLQQLNHEVYPVAEDWASNPDKSSGVGMQLSRRLIGLKCNIYQVCRSLVIHGTHSSVMHPEHRKKFPLITNHMKVTASMASIPSRIQSLKQTVDSIINQVDELQVYLNDYKHVPDYLIHDKITLFRSDDEIGDIGDAGKFYRAGFIDGYHFTIDDDLVYPKDYVSHMIAEIEKHDRKYAITCHGRVLPAMPIKSYYHNFKKTVACLHGQAEDVFLHIGGTGVMAYHTDTLSLSISDFKAANMGDIWFAIAAKVQNVPILAIKHNRGWIREGNYDRAYTIYSFCHSKDEFQTETVNAEKWSNLPVL